MQYFTSIEKKLKYVNLSSDDVDENSLVYIECIWILLFINRNRTALKMWMMRAFLSLFGGFSNFFFSVSWKKYMKHSITKLNYNAIECTQLKRTWTENKWIINRLLLDFDIAFNYDLLIHYYCAGDIFCFY